MQILFLIDWFFLKLWFIFKSFLILFVQGSMYTCVQYIMQGIVHVCSVNLYTPYMYVWQYIYYQKNSWETFK